MKTLIFSENNSLDLATKILQQGGLVSSPTETVYGLCANALDEKAIQRIFKAKGRPSDNPLIIHIASLAMLTQLVNEISDDAQMLIDAFWPGPLTLIFKATNIVPKIVTGGLDTVAIRFPSHPIMQQLILKSNLPLAAPSSNTSGKPSPTNAQRVIDDLNGKIDVIIDGGECKFGLESTVIDTTGITPTILRPGAITTDMILQVIEHVNIDPYLLNEESIPKSPGMKYTHYSPNANVTIVKGDNNLHVIKTLIKNNQKDGIAVGVLVTEEFLSDFKDVPAINLGSIANLDGIASNLFENLRQLDDLNLEQVYTTFLPQEGIGNAIMNRLLKACGNEIILTNERVL